MNKIEVASVIIPSYNRAKHITKALDSVYAQTYRPIEVLVIDDGSTDNTKEVVEKWSRDKNDDCFTTRYIYQENGGAPVARNTGIKEAKGKYLQFFDSDDYLMSEKIEVQLNLMKKENTPICICDYLQVDEKDVFIRRMTNDRSIFQIIKQYKGTHTAIGVIEKEFLVKHNIRWNPKIKKLQDREFYTCFFMISNTFSYVGKDLFKWIRHSDEGRIFSQDIPKRKISKPILISLLLFHVSHLNSISFKKYGAIFTLYKKLLRMSLNLGRFKPSF